MVELALDNNHSICFLCYQPFIQDQSFSAFFVWVSWIISGDRYNCFIVSWSWTPSGPIQKTIKQIRPYSDGNGDEKSYN